MKKIVLSFYVGLLIIFTHGFAQTKQQPPNEITGLYWSPKKDAKIEIFKRGEHYFGKSVWVAMPRKDNKNPNASLQKRDILGLELLTKFSYANGAYTNGQVYDPESGKTYDCKMSLEGNKLKVRGYIGISVLGRTEYFERIN